MASTNLTMSPSPGERLVRFVGDTLIFRLEAGPHPGSPGAGKARLRTTIGRAGPLREEIHHAHFRNLPPAGRAWRDLEMRYSDGVWSIAVPLPETGFFLAKAYLTDEAGWQQWPDGADFGVTVLPDWCRTANTIYCAFPRMFGPNREKITTLDPNLEAEWNKLDQQGCTIIPPSGKLRDVQAQLPHIFDALGCQILHLLPVSPTPTTMAKFGRFGSPYAVQNLTGIDPALVEFDRSSTGVEQFCELADAVHVRGGRLLLDLVINHTGWGSTLFEDHPEWFVRDSSGTFVSPGAWGTIWEDLVEIDSTSAALWDELAEVFLTWCRRGVDGFRCDAGYKVPVLVWQYITARVHAQHPDTVFFLEGLGGGWDDTAVRLTEGGMQWAYSEIFQNYSSSELCGYLDHAWKQSGRVGLLVNYSETHDNDRLAARGKIWSRLRNQLCALASVSGGFGFTNGVEWLAPEKVNVHSARGLAWGNPDNLVPELASLNRLLAGHPCFFDGVTPIRVSEPSDGAFAFVRMSADASQHLLVIANPDLRQVQPFTWKTPGLSTIGTQANLNSFWSQLKDASFDLLSGKSCPPKSSGKSELNWTLEPGQVMCLQPSTAKPSPSGDNYRRCRARAALAMKCAHAAGRELEFGDWEWTRLAETIDQNPIDFLSRLLAMEESTYPTVVCWTTLDQRRVVPIPPGHWVLVKLPYRFCLRLAAKDGRNPLNMDAAFVSGNWSCIIPPGQPAGDARLEIKMYQGKVQTLSGDVRFLRSDPVWNCSITGAELLSRIAPGRTLLLTNGRGAMTRINLDLGRVRSKYDCVLGANLHPELPVDRHVLVKRLRVWANADGFISPLNADNLVSFTIGSCAEWVFRVPAGDGRAVSVRMQAHMREKLNSVQFAFVREGLTAVDAISLRLTARFDLEDRNFHWETRRNGGADFHFGSHTRPVEAATGFDFQPAADRFVRVTADAGAYHMSPEWSERLPHPVEVSRGQTGEGDGWSPGWFDLPLMRDGNRVFVTVTAEAGPPEYLMADTKFPAANKKNELNARAADGNSFDAQLHRAASQFIVRRGDFKSVIAGYPWFLDWGRDTLICARGLIVGGWLEEVKQLLIAFGRFEENGTLPNTIHGADASNRDTSDAPLWYGIVAEELAAASDDGVYTVKVDDHRCVRDVLASIAIAYVRGTPNGIRVDAESGLVWSPSHFTWMDTNYPAGTPREGYPIEIQALWIRFLRLLDRLRVAAPGESWKQMADRATASLEARYWLETKGWYADSLIASQNTPASRAVVDEALRSNCLIAISFGQLTGEHAQRCVEAARNHLVVPGALRTLAPLPVEPPLPIRGNQGGLLNDPSNPYWGRYEGDEDTRRKPAYHNGTAWTWTFPIFCEALARVHDESPAAIAAARSYLGSMDRLLEEGCFGQLPEIVDGDAPHEQRGCDAQAWGATEALRVWRWLNRIRQ